MGNNKKAQFDLYPFFNQTGLDRLVYAPRIKDMDAYKEDSYLIAPLDHDPADGQLLHGFTGFGRHLTITDAMMDSFNEAAIMPQDRKWRLLDAPCSTGHEPYAISAHAIQKDFGGDIGFEIDAFDLSPKFTNYARDRIYPWNSLDGMSVEDRRLLTHNQPSGLSATFRIRDDVADPVTILDAQAFETFKTDKQYDAVFCANLFMYLNPEEKGQTIKAMADTDCAMFVFNIGSVGRSGRRPLTPQQTLELYEIKRNDIIDQARPYGYVPVSEHPVWSKTSIARATKDTSYTALVRI